MGEGGREVERREGGRRGEEEGVGVGKEERAE